MIVIILEKVPAGLRGELSRWLCEVKVGVFVGAVSALVRDELWQIVASKRRQGAALLVYPTNTEQGFAVKTLGTPRRPIYDLDGVFVAGR
ncbi:MAG: type I-E CRISPR-associated endoribonuclease Cas2 [Oscillatoriales cyanobacterium SM2_1_8]|nr:type I-E CRISPR-associated endoribonuclease Cas2 [Oscillatoriales cyanobacterium SM2_1_8]